jgi:3-hydroxyisobutyrate dehydrogenase-like beta-hydroxyacid dehydrogenase
MTNNLKGKVIGMAGCGNMGLPMAKQLQNSGIEVWGFDVRPAIEFGNFQNRMIQDSHAFSDRVDIVFSVVRDWKQTKDLLFDVQAIFTHPNHPKVLAISSTLSPHVLDEIQSRLPSDVLLIDTPMSGTGFRAIDGTLTFMIGGPKEAIETLMPAFKAMGNEIHHLGPVGTGLKCKVVNNFVAAAGIIAVRHALATAEAMGVEQSMILEVMRTSSGSTWYGDNFESIDWSSQAYDPSNTMGIIKKDVAAYLDAVSGIETKFASDFEQAVHTHMGQIKLISS